MNHSNKTFLLCFYHSLVQPPQLDAHFITKVHPFFGDMYYNLLFKTLVLTKQVYKK